MLAHLFTSLLTLVSITQALSLGLAAIPPPSDETCPIPGGSPMLKCDKNDPQILSISSLIIAPNPPKRGSTMILEAEGDIISEISEGAYVDVEVRLGYIKLLTQRLDLCAILADHARDQPDMQCPVQPGHHTFAQKVDIPNEVPAGRYVVVARAFTKDDELITCLTGTIVFKPLF